MDKKIRVLFDANPLVRQKTGVGYYTDGLIRALADIPQLELKGHYFRGRGAAPQLPRAANLSYSSNSWIVGMLAKGLRKFGLRLPWEVLARSRGDVLFFPDFTTWPSFFSKPRIVTIHDLTYIDHPEYVTKRNLKYLRRYVKRDAQRADLVLTVSKFSKSRISGELGIQAKKIAVEPIPPAKTIAPKKGLKLPAKFILFVGTIEPRKNVGGLLSAYQKLPEAIQAEYPLVLVGGQGWDSDDVFGRVKDLQAKGLNIIPAGYVDDATRSAYYAKASVVVVPSFYEGFGMPLLEAMKFGVPIAASNLPVFKEVAGNAVAYFDPLSADSISQTLAKTLTDKSLRAAQAKSMPEILANCSWPKVAQDIYQEIRKLAG